MLGSDSALLERCDCLVIELHGSRWQGSVVSVEELVRALEAMGFTRVDQRGTVVAFRRAAEAASV